MNINNTIDLDIFNIGGTHHLFRWSVLVGYSFEISNNSHLIPKVGFSYQALDTEEENFYIPALKPNTILAKLTLPMS